MSPTDNLKELTALIRAAFAPHLADDLRFVGTAQSVETTAKRFSMGHGFVAEVDGALAGTVVARPPQPESAAPLYRDTYTWSFGQLAVAPQWKGRGLGQALHATALETARSHSAHTMALDTAAPAKRLIALYESWGYRIVGTVDWRPRTNYESVLMARSLVERVQLTL